MSLLNRLVAQLKPDEGFKSTPYYDTVGVLTIGYGRNLEEGISQPEAMFMLVNDVNDAITAAEAVCPSFETLTMARREVLVNMAFNLGQSRLGRFKKMLAAIEREDWEAAGDEMLDSRWAQQVKGRAVRLAKTMRDGS